MARYIDADALQRRICGAKCGCEYEDCGCEGDCAFDHFISHAPTADVVAVIRCKDCVHYMPLPEQYNYSGKPAMHCAWHSRTMNENGYCDEARRKKEK